MGEIYSQAKKGRVWIGDEDEDIAKVFTFFRTLSNIEEGLVRKAQGTEAIEEIILKYLWLTTYCKYRAICAQTLVCAALGAPRNVHNRPQTQTPRRKGWAERILEIILLIISRRIE